MISVTPPPKLIVSVGVTDIERNLRAPLAGIARAEHELGAACHLAGGGRANAWLTARIGLCTDSPREEHEGWP